jgi:hypothetical protein
MIIIRSTQVKRTHAQRDADVAQNGLEQAWLSRPVTIVVVRWIARHYVGLGHSLQFLCPIQLSRLPMLGYVSSTAFSGVARFLASLA